MNILVYASNLAGIHGAGSAKAAYKHHGAKWGVGIGLQGNSYGIPTKDRKLNVLPLNIIQKYVDEFVFFAIMHPEHKFKIVQIGCGLAGYTPKQIAPLFKNIPDNCEVDLEWQKYITPKS